ncbi:hypothetical protein N7468_003244 [Penicillium chermesinum]|uniref:Survival motor neuron Tudor domain-containing protein n=1 Tax=Penicillium chermesinum TaxID=63820 RepID=A0A9W9P6A9_9EURO|nr:uncharacterized protein N7468_003244 [Penicillium chermesinum]KAJ5238625.1 hypothetical protein N7468_003244 [Penicillium chermesinum]
MGKSKRNKALSHEAIWDDSSLVQSWDDVEEEYKLYHSIHAKGENVEDVLREARGAQEAGLENDTRISMQVDIDDAGNLGTETEANDLNPDAASDAPPVTAAAPSSSAEAAQGSSAHPGTLPMPQPVLASAQDENLKNLMMAWYYAGYYTGLYEGQQKANK